MTDQQPPRPWETLDEFEPLADAEFSKWRAGHERIEEQPSLVLPADVDPASWNTLADFEQDLARAIEFETWAAVQQDTEE